MNRWLLLRELLRDLGTWVTGIGLIVFEATRPEPSELIVGAGLVLIAPGVYPHLKAVLPGGTGGESSERAPGERPSGSGSSPPGAGGERGG